MGLKPSQYWYGLLVLSLALVIAGGFFADFSHEAREVTYPFENALVWAQHHVATPFAGIFNRADLAARNRELTDTVDRLRLEVARLESVAAENRQLRTALNFPPPTNNLIVACPVLSQRPPTIRMRLVGGRAGKENCFPFPSRSKEQPP